MKNDVCEVRGNNSIKTSIVQCGEILKENLIISSQYLAKLGLSMGKINEKEILLRIKIPQQFSQFKNKKTLLVVTGKQDCMILKAFDGILENIKDFKIPTPHYSDKEGFFESRVSGVGVIRSGAVRELRDERTVIPDFIRQFQRHLKDIKPEEFSNIYVFTPSYMKNIILEAIPMKLKNKLDHVIYGNFYNEEPTTLLEKIKSIEEDKRKKTPLNPEAKRIIDMQAM